MTNLTEYTLPQLKQLQARIVKEVSKRESDTKTALLKRLRKLARDEGVELEELLGAETSARPPQSMGRGLGKTTSVRKAKKAPLPAKYRNPNDLDQSWSGRGRKPAWFETWVNNGGSIDALENAALRFKGRKKAVTPIAAASETGSRNSAAAASPAPEATSSAPTGE